MIACVLVGCAGADDEPDGPPESAGEQYPLTLWNRSQFTITAVYTHAPETAWEQTDPVIATAIAPEEQVGLSAFTSGERVTFVRQRPDGEGLTVTSEAPIYIDQSGYTLVLFDTSFRLLTTDMQDAPP